MCELLAEAGIDRRDTLLWNIVPWYVGAAGRIRPALLSEIRHAMPYTRRLLGLLPRLEAIVLIGRKAQLALAELQAAARVPIFSMYHPSARVFNVWPEKKREVQAVLADVAGRLAAGTTSAVPPPTEPTHTLRYGGAGANQPNGKGG
jgi:uracil-DNA glycosylase